MARILDKSGKFLRKYVCSECGEEVDNENVEECNHCKASFLSEEQQKKRQQRKENERLLRQEESKSSDLRDLFFSKTNLGIVVTLCVIFGLMFISIFFGCVDNNCFTEVGYISAFAVFAILFLAIYVIMFVQFYFKKKIKKRLSLQKKIAEKKESPYKVSTEKDVELSKKGSWISLILALYVLGFLFYVATILLQPNPMEAVWSLPYLAAAAAFIWGIWKRKKWLPHFYLYAYPIAIAIFYLGTFITTGFENINWQDFGFAIAQNIVVYVLIAWYFNKRCSECFQN